MPLQLRVQPSSSPTPSVPLATMATFSSPAQAPRLLPLSFPAKRARRSSVAPRRRPTLFLVATALLLFPLLCRSVRRRTYLAHSLTSKTAAPLADTAPPPSDTESEAAAPVQRPRTVLAVAAYGGIGNQIHFIAEALYLARRARLDLVIPSLPARDLRPHAAFSTPELSGASFWDISALSRALHPHSHVLPGLPPACAARFDAVYIATRSAPSANAPVPSIGSRVRQSACFMLADYDWGDEVPPINERECAERIFEGAPIQRRALPLSRPADQYFVDELTALRDSSILPNGREDPGRPACVFVDGHSFNIGGREGHEYMYSFMHYLEPAPRITAMVANWTVEELAVLHLRYDENECVPRKGTEGRVCVRVSLAVKRPDTVYWATIAELVDAVFKAMTIAGAKALYLAASPYTPEKTVASLRDAFAKKVRIVPRVSNAVAHSDQNFVERELAVRAKCFVGDFASTWSGTVYYKRRTLGMKTVWSSVLLGKSKGLGYYEEDNLLPRPEVFESRFAAAEA